MTKQEFLENLRRSLSGLDYQTINNHMQYYTEYIEVEIRKGRSEEEVLGELGDPRLIAKTILEMEDTESFTEEYVDEEPGKDNDRYVTIKGKTFRLPGWLFTLIVCVIFVCILSVIFTVVATVLPYVLFIVAVVFLCRWIRGFFR